MELKVNEFLLPGKIDCNYEELKQELEAKIKEYTSLVYSDEQIKTAKTDVAKLRKVQKAINDERIRLEKMWMEPFDDFKSKTKELISIVDTAVSNIDKQVKEFDRLEKEKKKEILSDLWDKVEGKPDWLQFKNIFDKNWLNKSTTVNNVLACYEAIVKTANKDLATLQNLPEFSFEATEVYKETRDLSKAILEGQRLADIQRRKQEQQQAEEQKRLQLEREAQAKAEAQKNEPAFVAVEEVKPDPVQEQRAWIAFKANLSKSEALKLNDFFKENNIEFSPL